MLRKVTPTRKGLPLEAQHPPLSVLFTASLGTRCELNPAELIRSWSKAFRSLYGFECTVFTHILSPRQTEAYIHQSAHVQQPYKQLPAAVEDIPAHRSQDPTAPAFLCISLPHLLLWRLDPTFQALSLEILFIPNLPWKASLFKSLTSLVHLFAQQFQHEG